MITWYVLHRMILAFHGHSGALLASSWWSWCYVECVCVSMCAVTAVIRIEENSEWLQGLYAYIHTYIHTLSYIYIYIHNLFIYVLLLCRLNAGLLDPNNSGYSNNPNHIYQQAGPSVNNSNLVAVPVTTLINIHSYDNPDNPSGEWEWTGISHEYLMNIYIHSYDNPDSLLWRFHVK